MDNLLSALLLMTIPFSFIAILLSSISIAVVVGLKNSTHKVEWKTFDPNTMHSQEASEEEEDEEEEYAMINPNRKLSEDKPFVPFPDLPKEEEPFADMDDPNNISHGWKS